MKTKLFSIAVFLILLTGCAHYMINLKTAENYYNAAVKALQANDWANARMYFSRAWGNAMMGNADTRIISMLRYEYGRASGVMCDWEEAEKALEEAFELDVKSGGPRWMPLVELARMSIAQKKYIKAKKYFERLMPILQEIQAETQDPLGYADLLDDYALVLERTGEQEIAQRHRERARQLRDAFPGLTAHTEITPYGRQCTN